MSKHVYATTTHHNQYSTSRYSKKTPYISSLEKLDRLTNRYQPKKVIENQNYAKLCTEGKCEKFEIPVSNYRYYYIHRETPNDVLNDLIDYAKETKNYTIDTEDQLQRPPQPSRGALIQIELTHEDSPSILILIETMHLPPKESPKFNKIKELCQIILSNNNKIFSWGDGRKELEKFYEFNLFDRNNIDRIKSENIQDQFKNWYRNTHPTCAYNDIKINEKYSLQLAIFLTFNKWLDKRMTLANWGCGIDTILNTIMIPREFNYARDDIIQTEEQYRQLMTIYALNDCFAVTELVKAIYSSSSTTTSNTTYENISEDEDTIIYDSTTKPTNVSSNYDDENGDELILNEQNDLLMQDDNDESRVHVQNELYEMVSDNELDNISLPDVLKTHRPFISSYVKRDESYDDESRNKNDDERVHVRDEPDINIIEDISEDELPRKIIKQHRDYNSLTKNQRKNLKKRAKRYRFEVIRQVYRKFTIRNIKKILLFMNINYVNFNVVGTTLFIGVKNEQIRRTVDELLHDGIFTKEHYDRIRKQLHLEPK